MSTWWHATLFAWHNMMSFDYAAAWLTCLCICIKIIYRLDIDIAILYLVLTSCLHKEWLSLTCWIGEITDLLIGVAGPREYMIYWKMTLAYFYNVFFHLPTQFCQCTILLYTQRSSFFFFSTFTSQLHNC